MNNVYIVSFSADSQQETMLFRGGSRGEVERRYFERFPFYHLDGVTQCTPKALREYLLRRRLDCLQTRFKAAVFRWNHPPRKRGEA